MNSALHAMKLGIRFIHQELNLCNDLTVFENLLSGRRNDWVKPFGCSIKKKWRRRTLPKSLSACMCKLIPGR